MSLRKTVDEYGPIALMGAGLGFATVVGLRYFDKRGNIIRIASREIGETNWIKYFDGVATPPAGPIAWCGVFALWALHRANVGRHIKWEYGKGFLSRLPMTSNPKPGDLAYMARNQHHAIVEKVDGNVIQTLDGNSYGQKVARNRRPREAFLAFYSIQPLIDGEI